MTERKITRALVSVSDKTGLTPFVRRLGEQGIEVLSTGGTARLLESEGVNVRSVDSYTGFPEIMNGRVKTLHPKVHGGILAVRDNEEHVRQMEENDIGFIDLVVVNLYPFVQTISKPHVSLAEAVENIDIGGPTMVRSAAKNHAWVAVVVDPADYGKIGDEIEKNGYVSLETRRVLAAKAFGHTAEYDTAITKYLSSQYNG